MSINFFMKLYLHKIQVIYLIIKYVFSNVCNYWELVKKNLFKWYGTCLMKGHVPFSCILILIYNKNKII